MAVRYQTMTLNKRLVASFGASIGCTVLLGVVCLQQGSKLGGVVDELSEHTVHSVLTIGRVNGLAKDLRGKMRSHVVEQDKAAMRKIEGELTELEAKLRKASAGLEADLTNDEQRRLFRDLGPKLDGFLGAWNEVRPLSLGHDDQAMPRFLAGVMPKFKGLQDGLDGLEARLAEDVEQTRKGSEQTVWNSRYRLMGLLALSLVVNVGFGWWTIRYANDALLSSVEQLRGSANLITGMARELNEANEQISSGATEQVAAIQHTTDAGERVRGMAEKFAEQAGTVSGTVTDLNRGMDEARRTLETMVNQMKAIEETSNKIQRLSGLVDSIAFQTHILSLNASIEAARSGEAGRGFEVVASEVKSLARQSGEAAQETAKLIAESLTAVSAGSKSLTMIVETVKTVGKASEQIRGLVDEIENASKRQASNMTEISTSLREVEVVSSRTAAAAEQGFAQQREMETQASALLHVVEDLESLVTER